MLDPQSTLPDAARQVGTGTMGKRQGKPRVLAPSLQLQPQATAAPVHGRRTKTLSGAPCCGSPGGTAVSGPAGPGAAPDGPEKLLPQGPGGPQPKTAHPGDSRGRSRVRLHTGLAPGRPQRTRPGAGISQWKEAEGKGRRPLDEVAGSRCLRPGAQPGPHSWEKQPRGHQQMRSGSRSAEEQHAA